MRVTIYQPRYFPQLHYFNRMLSADIFVFLDDAQYTKSLRQDAPSGKKRTTSFQSDTPIKLATGKYLLTIPVHHNGYMPINKTTIDYNQHWFAKHLSVIKSAYKNAMEFAFVFPSLKSTFDIIYTSLASLNIATTLWALSILFEFPRDTKLSLESINAYLGKQNNFRLKKIILGSELGIERPEGLQKGTEWTTEICIALNANEYLHGGTALNNYMDLSYYTSHGIQPVLQNWQCRSYTQQFSDQIAFIPNLSIIDLLCNVEAKQAQKFLV